MTSVKDTIGKNIKKKRCPSNETRIFLDLLNITTKKTKVSTYRMKSPVDTYSAFAYYSIV
jgi:hypothetical protein